MSPAGFASMAGDRAHAELRCDPSESEAMGRASREQASQAVCRSNAWKIAPCRRRSGSPGATRSNLTLSFVPDGTAIAASYQHPVPDAQRPAADRGLAARSSCEAFQTWAVNANINIGLVSDGGQPLGVAGQPAARPAVRRHPHRRPADGSRHALDLRAQRPAGLEHLDGRRPDQLRRELQQRVEPPPHRAPARGRPRLRHRRQLRPELADVFARSRDHSADAGDIAALQALYGSRAPGPARGVRRQRHDRHGDHDPGPGRFRQYTGATPLVAYGDITTNQDVDCLRLQAPNDYTGPVTIRVAIGGNQPADPPSERARRQW